VGRDWRAGAACAAVGQAPMSEDYRMSIFEAAGWAWTFFFE